MPEEKPYDPYKEFIERADNYGFEYKIESEEIVESKTGVKRLAVSFKTETNKEGYCLLGLMAHWKNESYDGSRRCYTYNYMMVEPRRPVMYFDIDENNNPIKTVKK